MEAQTDQFTGVDALEDTENPSADLKRYLSQGTPPERPLSDGDHLIGWEKRITSYLDGTPKIGFHAWMIFLPHKEANDALTLLSDTHPGFVTEIRDAVQVCSDARERLPEDETAVGDLESTAASYLRGAMEVLARRVLIFADELDKRAAHPATEKVTTSNETSLDDLVTLRQVSPLTGLVKRTLERYLEDGALPDPDITGGHGKAHKWYWSNLRPSLQGIVNRQLPEAFPGSRIRS